MRLVLTESADRDIARVLDETFDRFGALQFERYSKLVEATLDLVGADPLRPSSRDRSDIAQRMRSLHMSVASGRVHGASHIAFYLAPKGNEQTVYLVRLLHQSMEPTAHVKAGLNRLRPD